MLSTKHCHTFTRHTHLQRYVGNVLNNNKNILNTQICSQRKRTIHALCESPSRICQFYKQDPETSCHILLALVLWRESFKVISSIFAIILYLFFWCSSSTLNLILEDRVSRKGKSSR